VVASSLIDLLRDVNLFLNKYLNKILWGVGGGPSEGQVITRYFYVTKDINESINEFLLR
jgi:hypothetical protein